MTVQVIDPACFGGTEAFARQTGWLANACRENPPRPGIERVRLPGENGLKKKRDALANGVELYPGIMTKLAGVAAKHGVTVPQAI
ncbi:MAG: Ldh family oxidoreductase [Rhodospirillales bacterium]|nr:Ldh family oxidoreductase [Rhodospirillales bacterium]